MYNSTTNFNFTAAVILRLSEFFLGTLTLNFSETAYAQKLPKQKYCNFQEDFFTV